MMGGVLLIALKKLNGAALRTPFFDIVVIQAIGRGTIVLVRILYRSSGASVSKSISIRSPGFRSPHGAQKLVDVIDFILHDRMTHARINLLGDVTAKLPKRFR